MIVFWKQSRMTQFGAHSFYWRTYQGRARLVRGNCLRIYPSNGPRRLLTDFIAFDDAVSKPPTVISSDPKLGSGVDYLSCVGAIAEHLPPLYIDVHGNIRKTNSDLTLVLPGLNWNEVYEEEFQRAIEVPF